MNILFFDNINVVTSISLSIICISQVVSGLEFYHLLMKRDFEDDGYFSWKILSLDSTLYSKKNLLYIQSILFSTKGFKILVITKIVCLILIPFLPVRSALFTVLILFVTIVTFLQHVRVPYGGEGSDQMSTIILLSMFLGLNLLSDINSTKFSMYFIALQSVLAYVSAGIAKLVSKKWRSGEAVFDIFNTGSYGSNKISKVLKMYPNFGFFLSWGVIIFECVFFLVMLNNIYLLVVLLFCGITFHILNAAIMGLNSFLLVFLSTYPCIIYLHLQLNFH